jgi:two-component system, cell cycle sensor histidine kinase and response regulator CckA
VQTTAVNLNEVITQVERALVTVIGKDIRLETALSPSLGFVLADSEQLRKILMNLAVNARDAMPAGGRLLIETGNVDVEEADLHTEVKAGSYVQLQVSDTGVGMTKDVVSHIFELFFTTKKPGEGTGLGLSIVYGIVKQSNGSIWVDSQPGEGTTFKIYLPRVDASVRQQELPLPPVWLRGTETVLVVDDQDQLRKLIELVLTSYGYRVLQAANPADALRQSERYAGPIHLLLTDVVMPGMTGPELADRIKPLRPSMQVIFMSGYLERATRDHPRIPDLAGFHLPKPFSPEVLAAKVREVLDSPRSAGHSAGSL